MAWFVGAVFVAAVAGGAYVLGRQAAHARDAGVRADLAANEMANTLLALRFIERGEIDQAKRLLQASTSGQLGWIMELPKEAASTHCAPLNTLKDYRQKRGLFESQEWAEYRALPGKLDDELKRRQFLDSLQCGNSRLYQVSDKAGAM